jgi:hypothetical protein
MPLWRKVLLCLVIIFIGLCCCCFLFRDHLLQWAFKKAQARIHDTYHATLSASSVSFSGLNQVTVRGLALQPEGQDTLLRVSKAQANISLANLLWAKLTPAYISIDSIFFTIYKEGERNNISFLRPVGSNKAVDNNTASGYRGQAKRWELRLFELLNTAFEAKNIFIAYQDSAITESVYVPSFTYNLHELSGAVINQKNADTLSISGRVLKKEEAYQCTITHLGNDTAYLPFLDRNRGLECRFHSITADVRFDNSSDECQISIGASANNFHINHWRLAREDVVLPQAQVKNIVHITDDAVELDSASSITLGHVSCRLFARYSLLPDTAFTLSLHMPDVAADSFFHALPGGMFGTLRGISCTGSLAYDLLFVIHTNNPDSLIFNSALKQKNLSIRHYGVENYARINEPFVYDAYDKDRLVRKIMVGPGNPYFTPVSQLAPYLAQCVLQSEDPSFMQHRGFLADAFRESIAKNYKEKRFARGGSTISMQLVKNVFLSRDKTVSRKAEEALIVYLIENLGLVPKERMLEVYLNVIEWGPNVYGIGEASHFYFNKKPAELTLQECLFLASIIPRPKSFQYEFDKDGALRSSMSGYFKILTTRMVWRGVLSPADTIGLEPKVSLKGSALHMIVPMDSVGAPEDSTEVD